MKIDNVNINNVISAYQNDPLTRTKGDTAQQANKSQTGQSNHVELSTRKSELEKLKKTVEAMPDVRSEKVSALKQRISEGTYSVDGVKVAEKMLEHFKGSSGTGGSK